jgi:excisionase family DNA binding protein
MPAQPLVGVHELARLLAVQPLTVYRLVAAKRIPVVKVGRKSLRFDPDEVRAALSVEPAPADTGEVVAR